MWSSDAIRNILLILYMIFMPIEVWSAGRIEITFTENNQVQGDHVLLGNVASIFAKNTADFRALSKLEVAAFPQDQNSISMPTNYLRTRVAELVNIDPAELVIHGPDLIRFVRADKVAVEMVNIENPILAEIKRMALEGKHIAENVQLILEPRGGFEKVQNLSLADYAIEPVMEKQWWKGEMNFRLQARKESVEASPWFAVSLRWYADAWMPIREIPFMGEMRADNFSKSHVDVTGSDGVLLSASAEELAVQLAGMRAKRTIRLGAVLTSAMLDRRPDGLVGQALKIIFVGESGLRVATDGALLENASIGGTTKARLRKTKKIVVGTFVSPNTMEVQL